jgi:phospholipid N-methyltransferase
MARSDTTRSERRLLQPDKRLLFLRGFLRQPLKVASVIPSSRFLERRLVEITAVARATRVVELGPGTGGTTRAFLRALPEDARLLAIELNPEFADIVAEITDPRLVIHRGDARHLPEILDGHGFGAPQVVVSGIPFSTMPPEMGEDILRAIRQVLAPGGNFVAYQIRDRVLTLGTRVLGPPTEEETFFLNVPPARIYRWQKATAAANGGSPGGSTD